MNKIQVRSEPKTGQSTLYSAQLGPTHAISRRYREFEELNDFLIKKYQASGLLVPNLPGKKAGINKGTSTEKNRQQLEVYVNQLLFDANFVKDPEVLRFFEIKPVAESPQSTPVTSPQQQPKQHTAPQHEERNGHDSMVAPAHPQHQVDGASQHHGDRQMMAVGQQMAGAHLAALPAEGPTSSGHSERGAPELGASGSYEGQYAGSTEEEVLCAWIEDVLGVHIDAGDLQAGLRSGVVLCQLVNRICPGKIPNKRISNSDAPFPQRENIKCFVDAVKSLGVRETDMMDPGDLFDGRNMRQVVINLYALGRLCYTVPGYQGPALGRPETQGGVSGPVRAQGSPLSSTGRGKHHEAAHVQAEDNKKYKWDVKAGGSYVPKTPAQLAMEREKREIEQAPSQGKQKQWEVKFAPQLATASRRTMVVTAEERVVRLMSMFHDESSLKTAMGGGIQQHPSQQSQQDDGYDEEYDSDEEEEDGALGGTTHEGVIEGLIMMLSSSDATEKAKAAAALCNICSETDLNRELVVHQGGVPSLIDMLQKPSPEVPFMQSAAAACICNLAANINSKDYIANSGAIDVLVNVLSSDNHAAGAQAAGALWSLCVDNDANKQKVADAGAIVPLISLLNSTDSFAQSQSAGALSECSIRNDTNKRLISQHGAIVPLVQMLNSPDLSVQRLASCALCNVCANHEGNKNQARLVGALPVLVRLLSTSQVPEVLSPVAGAICNLSMKCPENARELVKLGAVELLQQLVVSPIPSLHGNALAALEQLVQ